MDTEGGTIPSVSEPGRELQQDYPLVADIDELLQRCHVPVDCNLREHIGVIAVLWCGCFCDNPLERRSCVDDRFVF